MRWLKWTPLSKKKVTTDDAAKYLAAADKFAKKHAKDQFRVHVRYLEVAERFMEIDPKVAIEANKKSTEAAKKWVSEFKTEVENFKKARSIIFEEETKVTGDAPIPDTKPFVMPKKVMKKTYAEKLKHDDKAELGRYLLKEAERSKNQPELCYRACQRSHRKCL